MQLIRMTAQLHGPRPVEPRQGPSPPFPPRSRTFMLTHPVPNAQIRRTLIRLEDTIIFGLIERAQFAHNPRMYTADGFASVLHHDGFTSSWLAWLLRETEMSHAKIRRYDSPDEHPFTPRNQLPTPILPPLSYPALLYPNDINVNDKIVKFYTEAVVPVITRMVVGEDGQRREDDGNYGSAGTRDIECLQAVSRRIHCGVSLPLILVEEDADGNVVGMFVSESKFLDRPRDFIPHILVPNPSALEALITKPAVEARLLLRLAAKASWYGKELGEDGVGGDGDKEGKVQVEEVVKLYRDYIIPLTKDVEVSPVPCFSLDSTDENETHRSSTCCIDSTG
jgi:chorismate mutase